MSIKHILVHLDFSPQSHSRLEYALGFARRQQAFLSCCYAVDNPDLHQEEQTQLKEFFLEQTHNSGSPAEWLSLKEVSSTRELNLEFCNLARCADLVIVGQPDPKWNPTASQELTEKLVLHSGRPVLILPYAGEFDPECERVMVAWNGGRESTRSMHDALPLLQQARQVNLISLIPAGAEVSELQDSLTLLCKHLEHHGIQSHRETQVCLDISKGDILLNRSAEEGIGLLVAGGYYRDHLGKVAVHLLNHMTVPVLMAH